MLVVINSLVKTTVTYKLLSHLDALQSPPKGINELKLEDIQKFMGEQFDPKQFVLRDFKRMPGKTIQELASRIQHDVVTFDFQSVKDPLDETLRTRLICFVDNEVVLKAL